MLEITGGDALFARDLYCQIKKQPDGTFFIQAKNQYHVDWSSCTLSKPEFEKLVAEAKITQEKEKKQKNKKLVSEYLEAHPNVLGIKANSDKATFQFDATFTERPDGGYDLNAKYRIWAHYPESDVQWIYRPAFTGWRSFENNYHVTSAQFAEWLKAAQPHSA